MGRGPTPAGCSFQVPNRSENIRTFGAGPRNQNARVLVPLICLTWMNSLPASQASIAPAIKGKVATRANKFHFLS